VFPVDAQATHWKPRSMATDSAAVIPVSLNEPVGFIPWCLASSQSTPASSAERGISYSGVFPSRSVTTRSTSRTIGSSSRNRHTPLWSTGIVDVLRSCHRWRIPPGFGSRTSALAVFSALHPWLHG
jgi:hypothetical protein